MRSVTFLSVLLLPLIAVAHPQVSAEGQACLDCHSSSTPGIVEQWRESAHAKKNGQNYEQLSLRFSLPHGVLTNPVRRAGGRACRRNQRHPGATAGIRLPAEAC